MPVTARREASTWALNANEPILRFTSRWFDEGRAAAMQGLTRFSNPYRFHSEHAQHDAWIEGFDSFQR